ncbi:MAG: phasin family protein [Deltaproteobacteria bacterium]|nr:phasin family protein [Deltaproteobacteria bacterium]
MLELIEKFVLLGVGTLSMGHRKLEETVDEITKQLHLREDEGKKLLGRLQEIVDENQQKLESLAREEVQKACSRFGLITPEDLEALRKQLDTLEQRVQKLENPQETQDT